MGAPVFDPGFSRLAEERNKNGKILARDLLPFSTIASNNLA